MIPEEQIGRLINEQFRLLRVIGTGGFGAVFLALDLRLQREVAVKMHWQSGPHMPQLRARFRHEARVQARLRHPAIVRLLHFGEDSHTTYMVQEFVDGVTLKDAIEHEGPLSWERVAAIAREMLGALGEAHANGIVHRDVKPSNIMLATGPKGEESRLLDFGIAKIVNDEGGSSGLLTQTGAILGTPMWMAPEQVHSGGVGPKSDLYSLGCVLRYALTAELPFRGSSVMEILTLKMTSAVQPLPSAFSPQVSAFIGRATALDPAQRFASAEAMCESLDAVRRMDGITGSSVAHGLVQTANLIVETPPASSAPHAELRPELQAPAAPRGLINWTKGVLTGFVRGLVAPRDKLDEPSSGRPTGRAEHDEGDTTGSLDITSILSDRTLDQSPFAILLELVARGLRAQLQQLSKNAGRLDGIDWLPHQVYFVNCAADGTNKTVGTMAFQSEARPILRDPLVRPNSYLIVVLSSRPSPGVFSAWADLYNELQIRVICTTATAVRHSLEIDAVEPFIRGILRDWSPNPFQVNTPATTNLDYYGDGRRIRRLTYTAERSTLVMVVGLPKVGVTSMLRRTCLEFTRSKVAYIDCLQLGTNSDRRKLEEEIRHIVSGSSQASLAKDFDKSRYILIFDGFDRFILRHSSPSDIMDFVRKLPTVNRGVTVVLGVNSLQLDTSTKLNGIYNPFWRASTTIPCEPFTQTEVAEFVGRNSLRAGVMFDDARAIQRLHALSGGHPYLCRVIAHRIVHRVGVGGVIGIEDVVESASVIMASHSDVLSALWNGIGARERHVLSEIAHSSRLDGYADFEVQRCVESLERLSLLEMRNGQPHIRSSMLREHICRNPAPVAVRDEPTIIRKKPVEPDLQRAYSEHELEEHIRMALRIDPLGERRTMLMNGISPRIVTSLPKRSSPADQTRSDLIGLNRLLDPRTERFAIEIWLQNAERFSETHGLARTVVTYPARH